MMKRRHTFDAEALAEFEDAVRYYAAQQPDLGLRFIVIVESTIEHICQAPTRWRVVAGREVRRAKTAVFPYSVYYSVHADHVLILAVAHHSRRPGYWRHRQT